jgi:ATP-dependent Zn protease
VIHHILLPAIGITQVTIIGKDDADGYTAYDISSPILKRPTSREYLLDMICVSLAGRVAEQSKYGHDEIDAGALDDLEKATLMAWDAIARLGLDFDFGPLSLAALSKAGATSSGWLFDQAQHGAWGSQRVPSSRNYPQNLPSEFLLSP